MMTFNDVYLAQVRHDELIAEAARRRAENTPVTIRINVVANAINAVRAAFANSPRNARGNAQSRRTLARQAMATR